MKELVRWKIVRGSVQEGTGLQIHSAYNKSRVTTTGPDLNVQYLENFLLVSFSCHRHTSSGRSDMYAILYSFKYITEDSPYNNKSRINSGLNDQ